MPRDEAGNRAALRRTLVACKLLEPSGNPLRVCCWELGVLQGSVPVLIPPCEQSQRHHGLRHIHTKYPKKLPLISISSGHGFSSGPRAPREAPWPLFPAPGLWLHLTLCKPAACRALGLRVSRENTSVCGWGLMEFFLLRWRCPAPVCLCSDLREHTEGGVPTAMLWAG